MQLQLPDKLSQLTDQEIVDLWASQPVSSVNSSLWYLTRRMKDILRSQGIVKAANGKKYEIGTEKFDYDEDGLIAEFPAVGEHQVILHCKDSDQAADVIGWWMESGNKDPETFEHKITVSKRRMSGLMDRLNADGVQKLARLRSANGKVTEI